MALKHGPKGSVLTLRGWIDPRTGELLKAQRVTQEQLDAYNGVQMIVEPAPVVEPEPEMELISDNVDLKLFDEPPAPKPKAKKAKKAPKKKKILGLFG